MAGTKGGVATLYKVDDLFASTTGLKIKSITLSTAARDTGHPEGSTNLRKGLAVGKITASNKYIEYDSAAVDGSGAEEDLMVLAHEVRGLDEGDKVVAAVWAGMLFADSIHVTGTAPTWGDVQRIERK